MSLIISNATVIFRGWNKAVAYETARTVAFLASKGLKIYPQTLETYNAYVDYLRED